MTLDEWMSRTGLSDGEVAENLGIDRTTVSRIRRGKRWPTRGVALKLIELSDGACTLDELLGINSSSAPESLAS